MKKFVTGVIVTLLLLVVPSFGGQELRVTSTPSNPLWSAYSGYTWEYDPYVSLSLGMDWSGPVYNDRGQSLSWSIYINFVETDENDNDYYHYQHVTLTATHSSGSVVWSVTGANAGSLSSYLNNPESLYFSINHDPVSIVGDGGGIIEAGFSPNWDPDWVDNAYGMDLYFLFGFGVEIVDEIEE